MTEAIVRSRFDLAEADRVLTLITRVDRQAQGHRQGRPPADLSGLGGSLEPFAETNCRARPCFTFDVVTQPPASGMPGSNPSRFAGVRGDRPATWPSWPTARSRSATSPSLSTRCSAGRTSCSDAGTAPGRVARWYEMHLLDELGTAAGGRPLRSRDRVLEAEERFRWSPSLGGILWERCPGLPHDRTGSDV